MGHHLLGEEAHGFHHLFVGAAKAHVQAEILDPQVSVLLKLLNRLVGRATDDVVEHLPRLVGDVLRLNHAFLYNARACVHCNELLVVEVQVLSLPFEDILVLRDEGVAKDQERALLCRSAPLFERIGVDLVGFLQSLEPAPQGVFISL